MFRSRKNLASTLSSRRSHRQAFTLVELLVSVGIFALMTALVVVKYGSFNNSLLLTNLAYDVAGTVRTAQTYGLSVKDVKGTGDFGGQYGLDFSTMSDESCPAISNPTLFNLVNAAPNARCSGSIVSSYVLGNGVKFSSLCVGSQPSDCTTYAGNPFTTHLLISFQRPNPDIGIRSLAETCLVSRGGKYPDGSVSPGGFLCQPFPSNGIPIKYNFARITLMAPDGSTRAVDIYKNGQITVQ